MKRVRLFQLVSTAFAVAILAACVDDDAVTPSDRQSPLVGRERVQLAAVIARDAIDQSVQGDESRAIENDILRMEAEVPSIGGMYFDPVTQRMVVIVTAESDRDRAIAAARKHYVDKLRSAVMGTEREFVATSSTIDVKRGEYPFSSLVAWHEVLLADLVNRVPQFISIDANEGVNRVLGARKNNIYKS